MFQGRHPGHLAGNGVGFFAWLIPLVLFAALIAVVVYALVHLSSHHGRSSGPVSGFGPDPAVEQARFRYARGEISRDEYFRLVGDLGWAGAAHPAGPGATPPPPPPAMPA